MMSFLWTSAASARAARKVAKAKTRTRIPRAAKEERREATTTDSLETKEKEERHRLQAAKAQRPRIEGVTTAAKSGTW